jgi:NADPH:quinone reductase-like Zn-dependent oxidoreductase
MEGAVKAIVQDRFGGPEVLELRDVAEPSVGDDDVLIQVQAAGCGPDVWHLMEGKPYLARLSPEVRKGSKGPRGWDVSGRVESIGNTVKDLRPGDEVMGFVRGSFAELVTGAPDKLVRKPANITFEQAAAVPVSGSTALQAVRDYAGVQPGQSVLVIGAGGGVGTLTVQIAKAFGADVTGVCSGSKVELVRSIGADDVIDYTREDFTDGRRSWDVIIDTAGRRPLHELRHALTPTGTLVIVGGDGGGNWTGGFFRGILRAPLLSLFSRQRLRAFVAKESREDLEVLRKLIEDGKVTPVVDRTFELPGAADALRYLEQGHPAGKVIVTI